MLYFFFACHSKKMQKIAIFKTAQTLGQRRRYRAPHAAVYHQTRLASARHTDGAWLFLVFRRPKHEVQTCFSIAVSTNKLYGTPRSPASTVIYPGAWAVFERLTKQVVNKRDEMVVATPPSRNRYQPGGPAARCFPPRAAPSYLARSVWIYKIWLRLRGMFLTFISFRSPTT